MAEVVFGTGAKSKLSQTATDAATTLYLDDAREFANAGGAGDWMYAQLIDATGTMEIVKVDVGNCTSTTLAVTRGQEGTSAQEWPTGTIVWQGLTAATLGDFEQQADARTGAFNPNSALTSNYMGEKFYQSDDRLWWKAVASGTQEWRLIAGVVYIADVTFDPAPGTHGLGTDLTMDTPGDPSADIYYTDDGTDPDETDNLYSAPVSMPEGTTTYKARGFGSERWESPSENITSGTYEIIAGFTTISSVVNAPTVSGSPLVRDWAEYNGTLWMMMTQFGGTSYLYSWGGSGSSWTLRDDSWPAGLEYGQMMAFLGSTLYILTNYRGLLSWNGSNLVDENADVGNNESPRALWALGGSLYCIMNYLGSDNQYRYDGGGSWTSQGATSSIGRPYDKTGDGGYFWAPYGSGLGRWSSGTGWTTYAQSGIGSVQGGHVDGDIICVGEDAGTDKVKRWDIDPGQWFIGNIHNYSGSGPAGHHYVFADDKVYYSGEDSNEGEWYKSSVETTPITTYIGNSGNKRMTYYPRLGSRYFGIASDGEMYELGN